MTNHLSDLINNNNSQQVVDLNALLSVLDALPELAFILSCDGDYVDIFGGDDSLLVNNSEYLLGKTVYEVMPKAKANFIVRQIRLALKKMKNISIEYELDVAKGSCIFEAGIAPLNGLNYPKPVVVWFARDITLQRKEQQRLHYLAHYDVLTQLPNRRLLEERLEEENSRCRRHNQFSALLFIDLDDFKQINDIYGHSTGDAVLIEIANRLRKSIRRDDFASRLAGDEFVVILSFIAQDIAQAKKNALLSSDSLLASLKETMPLNKVNINISASIGLSFMPTTTVKSKIIIHEADKAMYQAKAKGKSGISISDIDT